MDGMDQIIHVRAIVHHFDSYTWMWWNYRSWVFMQYINNICNLFALAASNLRWYLDPAFLHRLEKRSHVPLPNAPSRMKTFACCLLPPTSSSLSKQKQKPEQRKCRCRLSFTEEKCFKKFAEMTEWNSGSDIKLTCKKAAAHPSRRIFISHTIMIMIMIIIKKCFIKRCVKTFRK